MRKRIKTSKSLMAYGTSNPENCIKVKETVKTRVYKMKVFGETRVLDEKLEWPLIMELVNRGCIQSGELIIEETTHVETRYINKAELAAKLAAHVDQYLNESYRDIDDRIYSDEEYLQNYPDSAQMWREQLRQEAEDFVGEVAWGWLCKQLNLDYYASYEGIQDPDTKRGVLELMKDYDNEVEL
jgi:CRISPR/Cas system-associated endonuclease/helicase Cas3